MVLLFFNWFYFFRLILFLGSLRDLFHKNLLNLMTSNRLLIQYSFLLFSLLDIALFLLFLLLLLFRIGLISWDIFYTFLEIFQQPMFLELLWLIASLLLYLMYFLFWLELFWALIYSMRGEYFFYLLFLFFLYHLFKWLTYLDLFSKIHATLINLWFYHV